MRCSRWMKQTLFASVAALIGAGFTLAQPEESTRLPAAAALQRAMLAERAFDYELAATQYLIARALDPAAAGVMEGLARMAGRSSPDGAAPSDAGLRDAFQRERQRADALQEQVRLLEQSIRTQDSRLDGLERDVNQTVPQVEPLAQRVDRELADLRRMLSSMEREMSTLRREIDRLSSRIR